TRVGTSSETRKSSAGSLVHRETNSRWFVRDGRRGKGRRGLTRHITHRPLKRRISIHAAHTSAARLGGPHADSALRASLVLRGIQSSTVPLPSRCRHDCVSPGGSG